MMKMVRCAAAALALLAAPSGMAAGNPDAGRVKANTCMGCHGIPAYTNAYPTYRVPKLGGQSADYLAAALKAYKSGERPHKTMQAQAVSLSDQDIEDIAAYLAGAPALAAATSAPATGPTPDKVTVCAACHGADGKSTQAIYPHLAGQYASYLEHSLREYRAGSRKNAIMAAQAATLTDEDIEALSAYFAAQQSPLYTPSVHTSPGRPQ